MGRPRNLTPQEAIDVFGKCTKTPDECALELAMKGVSFSPSTFIGLIRTICLKIATNGSIDKIASWPDIQRMNGKQYAFAMEDWAKSTTHSRIMFTNIARMIKYTTEFDNCFSKKTLDCLDNFKNELISKTKLNYRLHNKTFNLMTTAEMWENIAEIYDLIADKLKRKH